MPTLPTLSCRAARELDARAIDGGVASLLLMENAGRACAMACLEMLAGAGTGNVVVLAGPGNNGGDGFVIARTLFNHGVSASVFFVGQPGKLDELSPDAQTHGRMWRALAAGQTVIHEVYPGSAGLKELRDSLSRGPALIVDSLFGSGLSRELTGIFSEVVDLANAAAIDVLAVDIPSGLHGDTGQVLGTAIRADRTVTFVAHKPGLLLGAGPAHAGAVQVAEIGIPRPLIEAALRG
ncbi:MAG: hydroxyethylthiazole kinase-like uncharacterized protein yjeF [Bacteroidia bacterium]|jgi:NAD(P)H-hydrate epimerase